MPVADILCKSYEGRRGDDDPEESREYEAGPSSELPVPEDVAEDDDAEDDDSLDVYDEDLDLDVWHKHDWFG